ncbi:FAD binding domain [Fusarium sporotrichioides]|uniref:FAD binding domain n=1 Tax=Fusarium sporotrichioides TaxID=5514 RepID=A0A395SJ66_FUSSP|nr:FAD binding domain [Fusarium sporotrichioides]
MDASLLPLDDQISRFKDAVKHNKTLMTVLSRAAEMKLPNWYLAAGALTQTVWNVVTNRDPEQGIDDYDLIYFDASDLSWEAEDAVIQKGKEIFKDIPVEVEIRNQARVHLWYEKKFGRPCPQHISSESSMTTWGTNTALIGVRLRDDGGWDIFAPWGLSDMFRLIVRPNQQIMSEETYTKKTERWIKIWPEITVMPWK